MKTQEICIVCADEYPPNGILMCDDCGMNRDMEQQREKERARGEEL